MKAEDVKTFGRWVRAIGQDMIDYPDKYKNLEATHSPTMDAIYDWNNLVVGYVPRGWEALEIKIVRNRIAKSD